MKTPDRIADEALSHFGFGVHDPATGITAAAIIYAIKADRAQRTDATLNHIEGN